MFNEAFQSVLRHQGVVSITTWQDASAHVSNTWNSYLRTRGEDRLLIPAAWMHSTEKNILANNRVILTLGSDRVQGKMGMGTGFVVEGTARFLTSGEDFDRMKEEFPFLTRVLELKAERVRQTI